MMVFAEKSGCTSMLQPSLTLTCSVLNHPRHYAGVVSAMVSVLCELARHNPQY
ncbi:hypothetical protein BS47DRAFT_1348303 [Hydnum rufescens UP504]|uniref:Uncharacterized protein n=1 Tax=Hydnum rufescens UP504 TaxID=1448309 RepID=A0A9P6AR48_9AGAM|nr:hypothetical protein BS47DRAFT_1348303 [Hydnum rufescens UP504]